MKNTICKIIFLSIIFLNTQSIVFAFHKTIDESEINIGGIGIGSSLDYVEQIYGQPTTKKEFKNYMGSGIVYNYKDKFIISALYTKSNGTYIDTIICKENNLSTPSGFSVGTPYEKTIEKYGKGNPLPKERITDYKKDLTYYEHSYGNLFMLFTVDKKGIIQEIKCYIDT